jgi:hypothetical protein
VKDVFVAVGEEALRVDRFEMPDAQLGLAARADGSAGRFWRSPLLCWLGKYSYGIYVFQGVFGPLVLAGVLARTEGAGAFRQSLAYVKGAVIDVTVTFAPPAPQLPRPEAPLPGQQVAGANVPAAAAGT